jgi:hypothetical protein
MNHHRLQTQYQVTYFRTLSVSTTTANINAILRSLYLQYLPGPGCFPLPWNIKFNLPRLYKKVCFIL